MTQMLASVNGPTEAEIALVEGADIIDLKDPAKGAFGAVDLSVVEDTVKIVAGRRRVSAVSGELPMEPSILAEAATALAATGVDFVKVAFFPSERAAACIAALAPIAERTKLIAVCFADLGFDLALLQPMAQAGFAGAMLDTATKAKLRLIDYKAIPELDRFVQACRREKLLTGLAGALEAPDIDRLLLLRPDFLGFRSALCSDKNRSSGISAGNVRLIRDLIPRLNVPGNPADHRKVDWRFLAARGYSLSDEAKPPTDRIFVHDLILPVSIGAYDYERNLTQNVCFNIDADVRRSLRQAEDMRDVFSYDVVVDAIKLILARGHVALVETLAEQIADAVLAYPRVISIRVRVEKLEIIDGRVGVEITRERAAQSAAGARRPAAPEVSSLKTGF
jgi:FolB domain-containing protein